MEYSIILELVFFCKGIHYKSKEFAPCGSKFFTFKVDPFSGGA